MMTRKEHGKLYRDWFKDTFIEQQQLLSTLVGQSIKEVIYTHQLEGWDIDLPQNNVIHIPTGFLIMLTHQENCYRLFPNFQDYDNTGFGMTIEALSHQELEEKKWETDQNQSATKQWSSVLHTTISSVNLHWRNHIKQSSKRSEVRDLETVCSKLPTVNPLPEILHIKFSNDQELILLAAEPDSDLDDHKYTLLRFGEETMLFFDIKTLEAWGIPGVGYRIVLS